MQILFDRTYNGTLNYRLNPVNTLGVTDPTAAAATGPVAIANTNTAFIPVPIADDAAESGQRAIVIDLKLNAENYFIGGRASHVVLIEENDTWWIRPCRTSRCASSAMRRPPCKSSLPPCSILETS